MGVLLLHLRTEMGASVWEQFPQLKSLPEGDALVCFVAAQCLPAGASTHHLMVWIERICRLLSVYRQCRGAFHMLSSSIEAACPHTDGSPVVLMALSSERWPTFREMFPGIKDDVVDDYGPSTTLNLPGKHIAMINRCLGNRDATFTNALTRCLAPLPCYLPL